MLNLVCVLQRSNVSSRVLRTEHTFVHAFKWSHEVALIEGSLVLLAGSVLGSSDVHNGSRCCFVEGNSAISANSCEGTLIMGNRYLHTCTCG